MPAGGGWDETGSSYRYRVRDPEDFQNGTFRTIAFGDSGIKAVVGKLPGEDTMTIQSLIFPKDKFTEEGARKWIKEHPDTIKKDTRLIPEDEIGKHYPGRHDQKTHGNWARARAGQPLLPTKKPSIAQKPGEAGGGGGAGSKGPEIHSSQEHKTVKAEPKDVDKLECMKLAEGDAEFPHKVEPESVIPSHQ